MTGFTSKRQMAQDKALSRPVEADYTSHVAYTRALEAYFEALAQPPLPAQGLSLQEQLDKAIADREKADADRRKASEDLYKADAEVERLKQLIEEKNT